MYIENHKLALERGETKEFQMPEDICDYCAGENEVFESPFYQKMKPMNYRFLCSHCMNEAYEYYRQEIESNLISYFKINEDVFSCDLVPEADTSEDWEKIMQALETHFEFRKGRTITNELVWNLMDTIVPIVEYFKLDI